MSALIALLCVLLLIVVVVQVARISELVSSKDDRIVPESVNKWTSWLMLAFVFTFLVAVIVSGIQYKNWFLGFGPNTSASVHGAGVDASFAKALFFTGIVFVVTHILLFYFAYKYREDKSRKALFMPHDNKLEVIWTVIPAVVLTFLVVDGLAVWNQATADVADDAVIGTDYIEIEATAYQFGWEIRYPGTDNVLGRKNYRLIDLADNSLGLDFNDIHSQDDFVESDTILLPKGMDVRVRITSKDVLHNFYLPQFRVKMDCVPGIPTFFKFNPIETTEDRRERLGQKNPDGSPKYPEWHTPASADAPDGPKRYEVFNYELACAELCGTGHFGMQRIVKIVEPDEYYTWLANKTSIKSEKTYFELKPSYFKDKLSTEAFAALSKASGNTDVVGSGSVSADGAPTVTNITDSLGNVITTVDSLAVSSVPTTTVTIVDAAKAKVEEVAGEVKSAVKKVDGEVIEPVKKMGKGNRIGL